MIRFMIDGREVSPDTIEDQLMALALESVRDQIQEQIGAIRDPETGAFPTVIVRGSSLDDLSMEIEGPPGVIEAVKQRLGLNNGDGSSEDMLTEEDRAPGTPQVFLSYAFEDSELAESIATALQANGIDTWWANWCMRSGDSLRQKIDEGLSDCTHFLVLLTPNSIVKPWVRLEMDAGLMRKLNDQCLFIPVRHELPAGKLPPLLSGMLSPEIKSPEIGADPDISQLIQDIHGVSRKPPLGPAPEAVRRTAGISTGYSPAATALAELIVRKSRHGLFADPQLTYGEAAEATGLSLEDIEDALYELTDHIRDSEELAGDADRRFLAEASFFAAFDRFWMGWDPAQDALKLAADIANDANFPAPSEKIAELYGWPARRLNPAVCYLLERGMLANRKELGSGEWLMVHVYGKEAEIRRFLKGRT